MTTEAVFLTTEELSERYRGAITVRTLTNWRVKGIGPRPTKLGKAVLYRIDDVEAWEARHVANDNRPQDRKTCGKRREKASA